MAPYLGADNAEILSELGYAPDEIESLGARRVLHHEVVAEG
jgi:crotonobetainyl-CoA:carnitine CoA-transferase CaiB-like acyl-CoA transferase